MPPTLLVVDDEIELVLILVRAARERGYDATGTIDPTDVIPRIRARRPDVVLLDLRMPRVDGRDLLVRIRAESDAPAVIVITGWIDEHTDAMCLTYGATDVVRKPFDLEDLFRRVASAASPADIR